MARPFPCIRMGDEVGGCRGPGARPVCDLSGHRCARPRYPFQPGLDVIEHNSGLGGTGADHRHHDAWIRCNHPAVGDRGDRQRRPPVSDGGVGSAPDADAGDETLAADPGGAFHRDNTVGGMSSLPAAGAARQADRLRSRPRLWPALHQPLRQHHRLLPRGQPVSDICVGYPAADAAGVFVLDRPQLKRACRCGGAGAGPCAVSAGGQDQQRPRHPRQRRGGGQHCLWRASLEGARMSDWLTNFLGDWHALVVLVIAGAIPNQIWRMLGLWLGGGLDEGSELLVWVRAVATAILAGVIAQILVEPPGALASVPDVLRYGALVAGFIAFVLLRRSILAGVVCGEFVMLAGKWWLG